MTKRLFERLSTTCAVMLLVLPSVVQAQYTYTTNNGTITITKYTGTGGAVSIPSIINNRPVTSIGRNVFAGCSNLTGIIIPNSVTNIGNSAFHCCTNLANVMIGHSVTSIGSYAFFSCTRLTDVNFLGNAPRRGLDIFYGAANATVYYSPKTTGWGETFGGRLAAPLPYTYTTDNGTITITKYIGPSGAVDMPNEISGLPVVRIGDRAFDDPTLSGCSRPTSVTIPDSVTSIGKWAFAGCGDLTSVTIPDGVTNIEMYAFAGCTNLASVMIGHSVTSIGDSVFHQCTRLSSVTIPDSVASIGNGVFYHCVNLTKITVDASNPFYRSVDNVVFNKRKTMLIIYPSGKIGSYTVPNGVTRMELSGSVGLTSVTIPDSVTIINGDFFFCPNLTSVTIPDSVTFIGGNSFYSCSSLTGVYFQGNAPDLGDSNAFNYATNAIVYYLPGTTGWRSTFCGRPTALWTQ